MTLTKTLLTLPLPPSIPSFQTATATETHGFLTAAAKGTLPKPRLSAWLTQDRLYIHAYIRFIGLMLAKLQLPVSQPSSSAPTPKDLEHQTLTTLTSALNNITRELDFFGTVAREYGLDLNASFGSSSSSSPTDNSSTKKEAAETEPTTQAYTDLFISAGSAGSSLLEGLVVLWATEVCYLTVWRNVRAAMALNSQNQQEDADADGGALREKLVPNWTCAEFEEFVEGITALVDAVAEREVRIFGEEEVVERCARWWRQVVWLEGRFWPDV
ncbi:putative transcription regulator PAB1642 [Aspergillus homomorphus CBS 101889]|uniref:Heme oxygenase-like protein n=1 Tax=Aspergillus homomorphus (strain CBS 101889) TaxID=1450537 RepID=A0A395I6C8_ASPHC|nr:heme oxygenase-like protein [Aspergillus homomorphus CBS 101889]RAL15365.1 heme oxygenase-like protein [Aspergillus homomorphus CBS 101889]